MYVWTQVRLFHWGAWYIGQKSFKWLQLFFTEYHYYHQNTVSSESFWGNQVCFESLSTFNATLACSQFVLLLPILALLYFLGCHFSSFEECLEGALGLLIHRNTDRRTKHGGKVPITLVLVTKKYKNKHSVASLVLTWQAVGSFFTLRLCPVLSSLFLVH